MALAKFKTKLGRRRWVVKSGKIYIVPTRFGVLFLFSIIAILLAGAIYTNNLVNLLGFFLLAIVLVAMVQTHNNLKNVVLQTVATDDGFADARVGMIVALQNTGNASRFSLEVRPPKSFALQQEYEDKAPLLPRGLVRKRSFYAVTKRGRHNIERIKVSTVYPVGLFRAWMWLETDASFIVYPERKGRSHLPKSYLDGTADAGRVAARGGDDFRGHRPYATGDPGSRIDWKAFARGRPLLVKEFDGGNPQALIFRWDETPGSDIEAKLSQLTLWIERAYLEHLRFALKIPGVDVPAGDGLKHYERCLRELALYQANESRGAENASA